MKIKTLIHSLALAAALVLSSVLAPVAVQADGHDDMRFVLVSHAPDSDSWWNTIKNAIREASEHVDVEVEYRNPPTGDLADMARIIEQVTASNPDGIITTIADYDVLRGPITKAIKKGIPVVTINSGTHEQSRNLGALMHVGQPEYDAGHGAGRKAKEAGVTKFLCVNHFFTNPVSVERCQGFADALGIELAGQMIDSGQDPAGIQSKVEAHLRANPDTNGVLTLGPTSAHPTLRALSKLGNLGDIYFATFDLSEEIAKGIKDGVIAFGIDQQPFLQGYLPVTVLALYNRYGVLPGNNINSGPGFVTKESVGLVEKLAGEYR